jgi:hypothetical protein
MKCFECESEEDIHMHHVVPQSLGGTKMVALCSACHAKVHGEHLLRVSKLTSEALKKKKSKNLRWCKNAPYGTKWVSDRIVQDQAETEIIKRMHILLQSGMSMLAIANTLTNEGHKSRTGKNFSHMTVRRILSDVKQ